MGEVVDLRKDVDDAFVALEVELGGGWIPDPQPAKNVNFTAVDVVDPITEVAPTAARKFDPRTALTSMAFTIWKSNAAAFGVTIDVTSGGNAGWTTDAGLNTDFTLPGSTDAAAGQWLIRIDLPNKRVSCMPAT